MIWAERPGTAPFTSGKSLNTAKFLYLEQRDQAGVDCVQPLFLNPTAKAASAHPTFDALGSNSTRHPRVPTNARKCRCRLEAYVSSGTGYLRGVLGGIASADLVITATAWTFHELVFADVRSLRNRDVDLVFMVSGGVTVNVRMDRNIGLKFTWN